MQSPGQSPPPRRPAAGWAARESRIPHANQQAGDELARTVTGTRQGLVCRRDGGSDSSAHSECSETIRHYYFIIMIMIIITTFSNINI